MSTAHNDNGFVPIQRKRKKKKSTLPPFLKTELTSKFGLMASDSYSFRDHRGLYTSFLPSFQVDVSCPPVK
jgi:hypothetical protein